MKFIYTTSIITAILAATVPAIPLADAEASISEATLEKRASAQFAVYTDSGKFHPIPPSPHIPPQLTLDRPQLAVAAPSSSPTHPRQPRVTLALPKTASRY
ncbi:hypothetical protein DSL72_002127 [Monilinia vaccinii-corymbosi]|uniref:Uncharacterized protein n=1 Tax=Monilinia vaccinii-corymbosi TaxID=61207 RepID=A0A8A3PBS9_9HELO|nr:hypothetical protein DSL72_002127 [Monilinia vaccinii-corymbosi]